MEEHINHIQGIYCIKYKLNIIYIGQSVEEELKMILI